MDKPLASLPRLNKEEDLTEWARQLVDHLEGIFVGRLSVINGAAIVDQSIPAGKMKP